MSDYIQIHTDEKWITISFACEDDIPFAVGEKMGQINADAYMNGYNWDALFQYYLKKHAPALLEGLDSDPEAGSYAAHYRAAPENEEKAQRFAQLIRSLVENEEELCRIVRDEGHEIMWD